MVPFENFGMVFYSHSIVTMDWSRIANFRIPYAFDAPVTAESPSEYCDWVWYETKGQSNLTKSASRGAHSPVRGHPRGSKVVPLNSWGRVSY